MVPLLLQPVGWNIHVKNKEVFEPGASKQDLYGSVMVLLEHVHKNRDNEQRLDMKVHDKYFSGTRRRMKRRTTKYRIWSTNLSVYLCLVPSVAKDIHHLYFCDILIKLILFL